MDKWLLCLCCLALAACGEDPKKRGTGGTTYQVGDAVDLNMDGKTDGIAVDTDGDGTADAVDTNGDGLGDQPLPGFDLASPDSGSADGPGDDSTPDDGTVDDSTADDDVGGLDEGECASISKEAEIMRGPADIIVALDTSFSMAPQICNTSKNLTAFVEGIGDTTRVSTLYNMNVLGGVTFLTCDSYDPLADTEVSKDAERYKRVDVNVDSWNALTVLLNEYGEYSSFLRDNAPTHIVVVSDDESDPLRGGMLAADFKSQMEAKLGHEFYFHAIVADGKNGCLGAAVGTQYLELADATGGQKLSMCEADWSVLFDKLEAAVIASAPLPCDFEIPAAPAGSAFDAEAVQLVFEGADKKKGEFPRASTEDKCGTESAWFYDDPEAPKRVELCPAACTLVKAGGRIDIAFGCAPSIVL